MTTKESKVLLTNINTVWGIIVNPVSPNIYQHILNFKDDSERDKFINKKLLNGKDYKVEILKQKSVSFVKESGSSATFTINPKLDYPNMSTTELLNKDWAILLEDGEYSFWAVIGRRVGSNIVYSGELDIFFTYNIKELFNDKETRIDRAMLDRWVEVGGKLVATPTYYLDAIKNLDSSLNNPQSKEGQALLMVKPEPIDEVVEGLQTFHPDPSGDDIDLFSFDTSHPTDNIVWSGNISADEKEIVLRNVANINWSYIASVRNKETTTSGGSSGGYVGIDLDDTHIFKNDNLERFQIGDESETPISIICNPMEKRPRSNGIKDNLKRNITFAIEGRDDKNAVKTFYLKNASQTMITDPFTQKNSYKILHVPPFLSKDIISITHTGRGSYTVKLKNNTGNYKVGWINYILKTNRNTIKTEIGLNILKQTNSNIFLKLTNGFKSNFKPKDFVKNPPTKAQLSQNNAIANNHTYEVKNKLSPYQSFNVEGIANSKNYAPQLFLTNKTEFTIFNSYQLGGAGATILPKNYSNNGYANNILNIDDVLIDKTNEVLPTSSIAYTEFMTRNMEQRQQQLTNKIVRLGLSTAGAFVSMNPGGGGGGSSPRLPKRTGLEVHQTTAFDDQLSNANIRNTITSLYGSFDNRSINNLAGGLPGAGSKVGLNALKIGAGVNFANSVFSLFETVANQAAQERDLKNTPDTIIYNNSDTIDTLTTRFYGFVIKRLRLSPMLDLKVKEFFYTVGYNLDGKLLNINDFLHTRFYFNYIQASSVYENIKKQLPFDVKLLIDATLANGVTIWHVDDVDTFKGIKNYKYENTERKLLV